MTGGYGGIGVLLIVFTIVAWVTYHKIFDIVYFDLSKGLGKEFIGSLLAGCVLTALTVTYWWIADIIIAIIALCWIVSKGSTAKKVAVALIAVILAVFVSVTGISYKKSQAEEQESATGYSYVTQNDYRNV